MTALMVICCIVTPPRRRDQGFKKIPDFRRMLTRRMAGGNIRESKFLKVSVDIQLMFYSFMRLSCRPSPLDHKL
jgi:hypothetical protein